MLCVSELILEVRGYNNNIVFHLFSGVGYVCFHVAEWFVFLVCSIFVERCADCVSVVWVSINWFYVSEEIEFIIW